MYHQVIERRDLCLCSSVTKTLTSMMEIPGLRILGLLPCLFHHGRESTLSSSKSELRVEHVLNARITIYVMFMIP